MTTTKKFTSGSGTRSKRICTASVIDLPSDCWSSTRWNSDLTGSLDFLGDDAHGIVERQTGLDAAHDGFDGIGQFVEELGLEALAALPEIHLGQEVAGSETEDGGEVPLGDEEQQGKDARRRG